LIRLVRYTWFRAELRLTIHRLQTLFESSKIMNQSTELNSLPHGAGKRPSLSTSRLETISHPSPDALGPEIQFVLRFLAQSEIGDQLSSHPSMELDRYTSDDERHSGPSRRYDHPSRVDRDSGLDTIHRNSNITTSCVCLLFPRLFCFSSVCLPTGVDNVLTPVQQRNSEEIEIKEQSFPSSLISTTSFGLGYYPPDILAKGILFFYQSTVCHPSIHSPD